MSESAGRVEVEADAAPRASLLPPGSLLVLLLLGLLIRLYDLTDPPLDFHPTRQFRSAIIARGMYYAWRDDDVEEWRREMAVRQWRGMERLEPPVVEAVVAGLYLLTGGERLWLARVVSSLAWVAGGLALFILARRISGREGALAAAAYMLLLPWAVVASRSFQPDPLMTALTVVAWLAAFWWAEQPSPSWRATVGAGLVIGLAPFVKVTALFAVLGALVGLVLWRGRGLVGALKDPRHWALGAMAVAPAGAYYLYGLLFGGNVLVDTGRLFVSTYLQDPRFYLDWQAELTRIVGLGALVAALAGTLMARGPGRALLVGAWAGYLGYGLAFPYFFLTHDYYHLPAVPLVALGLAPVGQTVLARLEQQTRAPLLRAGAALVLLLAVAVPLRTARGVLAGRDYRAEAAFWEDLGRRLNHRSDLLELVPHYGFPLEYYGWVSGSNWVLPPDLGRTAPPDEADLARLERDLNRDGLLVVTALGELESRPGLKAYLEERFTVVDRGEGFVVYDLGAEGAGSR